MNTIKHKLNLCIPVALLFTLNIYLFAHAAVYEKNMQHRFSQSFNRHFGI